MLSRIADAVYWMARYLERVDDTVRLIELDLGHLDDPTAPAPPVAQWERLLRISGNVAGYAAAHPDGAVTETRVLHFLTRDRANPNAVRACLRLARDNARIAREHVSKEMWEIVVALWVRAEPPVVRADASRATLQFCRAVRSEVAHLHAVAANTMGRGEAFDFHQLGTFVERADMTARILDVERDALAGPGADRRAAALLDALSGLDAYERTCGGTFDPAEVLEFVVRAREFPRALRFALDRIAGGLGAVGDGGRDVVAALQADTAALVPETGDGMREYLLRVLAGVAELDARVRNALTHAVAEVRCDS